MISFIIGLLAGVAMPVQTSVNAKLRTRLGSPYLSSIVSFSGGLICSIIVILFLAGSLWVPFGKIMAEPLWIWTGGACGSILVIISIVCLPKLGSVETMVMLVLGQIGIGLVIDNFGWFETDVIRLTPLKLLGAVLVLAGTVIVTMSNTGSKVGDNLSLGDATASAKEHELSNAQNEYELSNTQIEAELPNSQVKPNSLQNTANSGSIWIYRFGELIAGILAGLQIAINGRLGQITGSSFSATFISMIVGTLGVVLIAIIVFATGGRKRLIPDEDDKIQGKWWMWIGGVFGMVIVGGNAVIAKPLGTGLSVILNVVGQTFGGIVLDAIGFLGIEKKPVTVAKVSGVLLMNVGIVLVSLF